ncbi:MAG: heavy metal sensor histidine kinase [Bryobacteraceae bacterium]
MNPRSIRFRLTAWYSTVLALALAIFGVFTWFAVREILFHAVDETLADRVEGVRRFMENQIGALSVEEIRDEFKEHSVLGPGGDLFQVCDATGVWLYRSASLENDAVPIHLPATVPAKGLVEDRQVAGTSLRFLSRSVTVLGKPYTIQVAAPTHELVEGLTGFKWALILLVPVVLLAATAGGWWMSRRALQPVDQVTATARSIGEQNLGKRLPVPNTEDELQRLSETLNQMLDRIEGAFHRVTQFTADASHELRTPIALIRTTSEIALRKHRSDAEYREALDEVHAESVRTTGLIENLLTLARADAGKETLDRAPVDLASLVLEVSGQAEKLAQQKGITLACQAPEAIAPISGDRGTLRRLFFILLDNAVKYTPPGGQIQVGINQHPERVTVEVRDSGGGISQQDLPHIFERFYRSDKSRNRDSGGAGLGLSLAKWIVDAHGGFMEVESAVDNGSTFRVSLPKVRV